jgi:hypothetical protein
LGFFLTLCDTLAAVPLSFLGAPHLHTRKLRGELRLFIFVNDAQLEFLSFCSAIKTAQGVCLNAEFAEFALKTQSFQFAFDFPPAIV